MAEDKAQRDYHVRAHVLKLLDASATCHFHSRCTWNMEANLYVVSLRSWTSVPHGHLGRFHVASTRRNLLYYYFKFKSITGFE